jgi:guanylate kinase
MEIEQLAVNYQPDQACIETVRKSKILILVGVTSAGKDTLKQKLLENPIYHRIVTYTTRLPRVNDGVLETDGLPYHFVSKEEMRQLLIDHQMIEINRFGENYYGTGKKDLDDATKQNKAALGDIDVHGVDALYRIAPNSVKAIFVIPPDYETWTVRINKRYSPTGLSEAEWQTRRNLAIAELEHALNMPNYNFVVNDDLDIALSTINDIAIQENDNLGHQDDEARQAGRGLLLAIKQASGTR